MVQFLNTALFLHTHINRIDAKGRMSLPATFRTALAARKSPGVIVFQSLTGGVIEGWPAERMQALSNSLDALDVFSDERNDLATAIFGTAQELQLDSEGRCILSKSLCDYAGITGEAAFLGQGDTFQIWEPGALKAHEAAARSRVKTSGIGLNLSRRLPLIQP